MAGAPRTSKQPAGLRGELSGSAWVRRRGESAICPVGTVGPPPSMRRFGRCKRYHGVGVARDGRMVPVAMDQPGRAWPIGRGGLQSVIRTEVRSCGDVWIRQGLATGERE